MTPEIVLPPRRHLRMWWSRLKPRWPFLLWVLAGAAGIYLYYHGGQFGGMSGVAESDRRDIAPIETARLAALHVQIGQTVRAGDLLAEMDTTLLDAEMALEGIQAGRQFARAIDDARNTIRALRLRQAEGAGELIAIDEELERVEPLLARQLVDARTVAGLRARKGALKQAAALYPELIAAAEAERDDALARRASLEAALGEPMPSDRSKLGLLALRREAYRLFAPADGIVSRINQQPGNVVSGGSTVLTIIGQEVRHVVGFLPETYSRDVDVGMLAYVSSATEVGSVVPAHVVAVTPDILALPTRASPVPNQTQRGKRVLLELSGPHHLFPGESVVVRFDRPFFSLLMEQLFPSRSVTTSARAP